MADTFRSIMSTRNRCPTSCEACDAAPSSNTGATSAGAERIPAASGEASVDGVSVTAGRTTRDRGARAGEKSSDPEDVGGRGRGRGPGHRDEEKSDEDE